MLLWGLRSADDPDDRVGGKDQGAGMACFDCLCFLDRKAQGMIARQLAPGTAFVDMGRVHSVGDDADPGKQVEAAGARRGEDQAHQAAGPGPPRPGMKR